MKKIIIVNWKNYLSLSSSINICSNISYNENLIIAPAIAHLAILKEKFSKINFASQDLSHISDKYGPYTGETTAEIINDLGIKYAIIGHSERRFNNLDNADTMNIKIKNCLKYNITPIICIGENIEDKDLSRHKEIIINQLDKIFSKMPDINSNIIIAYEPFWSVGTGVLPSIDAIKETMQIIREKVKFLDNKLFLVYGGSVNAQNANNLIDINVLDGILIGKASIEAKQLNTILNMVK